MLSKENALLVAALLAAAFVAFCAFVGLHKSFHTCINEAADTYQAEHYQTGDQTVASIPFLHGYGTCAARVTRRDGDAITAISTAILTFVTLGLVLLGIEQSKTTRAQLRAYVFIRSVDLNDGGTWPQAPNPVQAGCPNSAIWIQNYGDTPAFKVRHWGNVIVAAVNVDGTVPATTIAISDRDVRALAPTTIAPGSFTHLGRNLGRAITPFEIQALNGIGTGILVYGRILYEDAFGTEHKTDYCVGYAGQYPPAPNTILTFLASGNDAT